MSSQGLAATSREKGTPVSTAAAFPSSVEPSAPPGVPERDAHWETCRNSLAIARLLAHERRSDAYIATVARLAVENACRAGLAQAGLSFDGDVERGLTRLEAPAEILCLEGAGAGLAQVEAAERVVSWVSDFLSRTAPERVWGF